MEVADLDELTHEVLDLDYEREADRIAARLREATARVLHKRGLVVAISGGVDSAVCAALAVRALGAERVYALILPERDSADASAGASTPPSASSVAHRNRRPRRVRRAAYCRLSLIMSESLLLDVGLIRNIRAYGLMALLSVAAPGLWTQRTGADCKPR